MDYFSAWCKSKRRLNDHTVIITGSNSGIGKETALDLYRRGARVIMACRDVSKAEEAKKYIEQTTSGEEGTGILVLDKLNLSSIKSVEEFAARVLQRERSVNALVNNAGVMLCPESRTEDGFETHMGCNHLGHALLTLLLLPLIIKSAPSRIVFVSSQVQLLANLKLDDINSQKTPYSPLRAYIGSKVANILFAKALDRKLKEHNVKGVSTYSLHPGIVKTSIGRHFPQTAWKIVNYGFQNYILNWCWKSPRCGAQTTIYCTVDEKCANESGMYYRECGKAFTSRQCRSIENTEKLWNITIALLNLHNYNPFTSQESSDNF